MPGVSSLMLAAGVIIAVSASARAQSTSALAVIMNGEQGQSLGFIMLEPTDGLSVTFPTSASIVHVEPEAAEVTAHMVRWVRSQVLGMNRVVVIVHRTEMAAPSQRVVITNGTDVRTVALADVETGSLPPACAVVPPDSSQWCSPAGRQAAADNWLTIASAYFNGRRPPKDPEPAVRARDSGTTSAMQPSVPFASSDTTYSLADLFPPPAGSAYRRTQSGSALGWGTPPPRLGMAITYVPTRGHAYGSEVAVGWPTTHRVELTVSGGGMYGKTGIGGVYAMTGIRIGPCVSPSASIFPFGEVAIGLAAGAGRLTPRGMAGAGVQIPIGSHFSIDASVEGATLYNWGIVPILRLGIRTPFG